MTLKPRVDQLSLVRYLGYLLISPLSLGALSCVSLHDALETAKSGMSRTITGPDGTPHELIQCFDIEICYKKAAEVCEGKYRIVDHSTTFHDKDVSSLSQILVKCEPKVSKN